MGHASELQSKQIVHENYRSQKSGHKWVRGFRSPHCPRFPDNLRFSPTRTPGVEMTPMKKTMEFTRSLAGRVLVAESSASSDPITRGSIGP